MNSFHQLRMKRTMAIDNQNLPNYLITKRKVRNFANGNIDRAEIK